MRHITAGPFEGLGKQDLPAQLEKEGIARLILEQAVDLGQRLFRERRLVPGIGPGIARRDRAVALREALKHAARIVDIAHQLGADPLEAFLEARIGGTVPGIGELRVITSPYHDPLQYPTDEDEDEDEMLPVPWVVSIDNFITDEECNRLIELGETMGYERSTISDALGDRASKERTSYNTFCEDDCVSD